MGSLLLLIPAGLHISGFCYVTEKMDASNAPLFLKEVMPVLFVLPSLHLICLTWVALLSIYAKGNFRLLLLPVIVFVFINMVFAFYLAAFLPAGVMAASGACYLLAVYESRITG